jgi:DNA repair photolyase
MKPIYKPSGLAKEYGDYACNIYTGCPHGCNYCFAPKILRRDRNVFHADVHVRDGLLDAAEKQLTNIHGETIHLCFVCDPYPTGYDTKATREMIRLIKKYGNHVQILTKGDGSRDFDLLDSLDWYGVTYSGAGIKDEPGAIEDTVRLEMLKQAKSLGISTWVSCEPVVDNDKVLNLLRTADYIDRYKIGKLNYVKNNTDWRTFGIEAEKICRERGLDYIIKSSLRKEMHRC